MEYTPLLLIGLFCLGWTLLAIVVYVVMTNEQPQSPVCHTPCHSCDTVPYTPASTGD